MSTGGVGGGRPVDREWGAEWGRVVMCVGAREAVKCVGHEAQKEEDP